MADRNPFVERLHGQPMLALYRAGRQADALAAYRALRTRLVDELGIEPSRSLRDLEAAILRQDPVGVAEHSASARTSGPPAGVTDGALATTRRGRSPARRMVMALLGTIAAVAVVAIATPRGDRDSSRARIEKGTNSVVALDRSGRVVGGVALRAPPGDVVHGAGAVWLSQFEENAVVRLDPRRSRIQQTIDVGSGPAGMAFGAGSLWVANSLDGTVSRIDPGTDRVVDTIAVGDAPASLAFDGSSVWVANAHAREVARIDGATGEVTARVSLPGPPTDIAYAGGAVWVSSEPAGVVFRIAPRSGDVAETRVGTGPTEIAAAAGGVWVVNTLDGTVSRIDPRTGAVTTTLPVGGGPVDVEAAFGSLWVAGELHGTLTRIDPRHGRIAQTIRVGGRPRGGHAGRELGLGCRPRPDRRASRRDAARLARPAVA